MSEKIFKNFHPSEQCPVREVLCRFGDKWSLLILITLSTNGTMRFSNIQRTIADISQRMLTVSLRSLEADGLICRKVYAEIPPRVEYCLSDLGEDLMPSLLPLVNWAVNHVEEITDNRKKQKNKI